jgi:hypothetical protein
LDRGGGGLATTGASFSSTASSSTASSSRHPGPDTGPGPGSSDREHRRLIGRPSRRWKIPAATRAYLPDPRMDWTGRRPRLPRRLRQHPHSKLQGPKPFQDVKTAEGVEIRVVVNDRKAWLTSTASPPPTTRPATASSSSTSPSPSPARDHGLRLATPHSTPDHRTTCKQLPSAKCGAPAFPNASSPSPAGHAKC